MYIDSHCHLNLLEFSAGSFINLDAVMAQCKADQIEHLLCVSIDLAAFPDLLAIAKKYPNVSISAGIHPNEEAMAPDDSNNLLEQAKNSEVVAIGETGLDYYRTEEKQTWQSDRFIAHIDIAKKLNKPLIIHTRNAPADTIDVLKNHAQGTTGVMHCFTEEWSVAKQALDLGFYISLSGIVTFKNAAQVHEVAKNVPIDRLLIETDSPYLAPMPHRGKTNYPHYVKHVATKIAELRGEAVEVVAKHTTENFYRLFNL